MPAFSCVLMNISATVLPCAFLTPLCMTRFDGLVDYRQKATWMTCGPWPSVRRLTSSKSKLVLGTSLTERRISRATIEFQVHDGLRPGLHLPKWARNCIGT